MAIKTSKQHYDAICGILDNRNRRLSEGERDALEYCRVVLAVEIADEVPTPVDPAVAS